MVVVGGLFDPVAPGGVRVVALVFRGTPIHLDLHAASICNRRSDGDNSSQKTYRQVRYSLTYYNEFTREQIDSNILKIN